MTYLMKKKNYENKGRKGSRVDVGFLTIGKTTAGDL